MGRTNFIQDLDEFTKVLDQALENQDVEVVISGTFDNRIYKTILDKVLNSPNVKDCKVIIPYITSSGIISRSYINKVCGNGSNFRINSQFRKCLVVIGNQAFVLFFSAKYNKQEGIKSHFECCMQTEETEAVEKIRETFISRWQKSMPLVN